MQDTREGREPGEARVKLVPTSAGGVRVEVHAKPRAKQSRVVGVHERALSLAIAAPPVDGAANEEVVRFLAELFGVPKSGIVLVRGASSRLKLLEVSGTSKANMEAAIAAAL